MNELIQQITSRTGLSPDQAQGAAETVIHFLKERLPAPLASHLDGLLGSNSEGTTEGEAPAEGGGLLGNLTHGLGGLLGGGETPR